MCRHSYGYADVAGAVAAADAAAAVAPDADTDAIVPGWAAL